MKKLCIEIFWNNLDKRNELISDWISKLESLKNVISLDEGVSIHSTWTIKSIPDTLVDGAAFYETPTEDEEKYDKFEEYLSRKSSNISKVNKGSIVFSFELESELTQIDIKRIASRELWSSLHTANFGD